MRNVLHVCAETVDMDRFSMLLNTIIYAHLTTLPNIRPTSIELLELLA